MSSSRLLGHLFFIATARNGDAQQRALRVRHCCGSRYAFIGVVPRSSLDCSFAVCLSVYC